LWLYTYRIHDVVRFIDSSGIEFRDPRGVSVQPWWSVYAALIILVAGAAAAVWLLPEGLPAVKGFGRFFSSSSDRRRKRPAHL